jgi:O-methyltransferase
MYRFLMRVHYVLTMPVSVFFILTSVRIHPAYRMGLLKRLWLGVRMFLNTIRVRTGTSYKSHLVMAVKILETPPDVVGDIVECGTWKGGSAVNLSLVCRITGRKLHIYDSFEGLPAGEAGDREAHVYKAGDYCGTLDEVKRNIARYGAPECVTYNKGWFKDTLPHMNSPVLLAFLDVDLEASLHVCVRYIWPHLVEKGYIFIDECVGVDYCALFFSEKYWQRYFNRTPPGLVGAGTGLPLGEYYFGPWADRGAYPLQHANAGAYTRKDLSGHWTYYPEEA